MYIAKKLEDCTPEEIEIRQQEAAERSYQGYLRHLRQEANKETLQERVEILWADYLARQEGK